MNTETTKTLPFNETVVGIPLATLLSNELLPGYMLTRAYGIKDLAEYVRLKKQAGGYGADMIRANKKAQGEIRFIQKVLCGLAFIALVALTFGIFREGGVVKMGLVMMVAAILGVNLAHRVGDIRHYLARVISSSEPHIGTKRLRVLNKLLVGYSKMLVCNGKVGVKEIGPEAAAFLKTCRDESNLTLLSLASTSKEVSRELIEDFLILQARHILRIEKMNHELGVAVNQLELNGIREDFNAAVEAAYVLDLLKGVEYSESADPAPILRKVRKDIFDWVGANCSIEPLNSEVPKDAP